MSTPHIDELRAELLATLRDLRNRDTPMEPDRARAVAQVASVLVDSARVEVEFLKVAGKDHSQFIAGPDSNTPGAPTPARVTTHRLR